MAIHPALKSELYKKARSLINEGKAVHMHVAATDEIKVTHFLDSVQMAFKLGYELEEPITSVEAAPDTDITYCKGVYYVWSNLCGYRKPLYKGTYAECTAYCARMELSYLGEEVAQ